MIMILVTYECFIVARLLQPSTLNSKKATIVVRKKKIISKLTLSIVIAVFTLGAWLPSVSYGKSFVRECLGEIVSLISRPTVWSYTNGRFNSEIRHAITRLNRNLRTPKGRIPAYQERLFISGKRKLLSLGEGDARYIRSLLEERSNKLGPGKPITNLHAVDRVYGLVRRYHFRYEYVLDNLRAFPDNYHFGYFQNMRISGPNGNRILFDDVISIYSLSIVMDSAPEREIEKILLNILAHMKKGGVLRSVPAPEKPVVRRVIERLQKRGNIQLFKFTKKGLLIQK